MRIAFLDVAGLRTRLLCQDGKGPVILFLHGLGTTAERWNRTIDPLSAATNGHIIAPDLLNSGFTDDVSFDGRPPQLVHLEHLCNLTRRLEVGPLVVIGSSYGGLLAALMALEAPGLVKQLVIVGSGSALHPPEEQLRTLEAARDNALRASAEGTVEAMRRRLRATVFDEASVPEDSIPILMTANAQPGREQALVRLYDGLIAASQSPDAQAYPRLERIAVPTLIITGREDARANWRRAEEAARRIPECRLHVYDRCGHAPMLEHAERFCADLRQFIAG